MFADTLLHAEQEHLLRLLVWAALSVLGGTTVFLLLTIRRLNSPLLSHFGIQMVAWGVMIAAIAGVSWRGVQMRDLSGEARLERVVWLSVGLDIGYVATGAVLAISAWLLAKRLGGVGAGVAIVVQGLALFVLDLRFAAFISR